MSANEPLAALLASWGIARSEIESALSRGDLPALAIERVFFPGEVRYDSAAVAGLAGIDPLVAQRLWRALGLPEIEEGRRFFNEADVEALRRAGGLVALAGTLLPDLDIEEAVLPFVRVFGSSIARISAAEVETVRRAAVASIAGVGAEAPMAAIGAYVEAMKDAFDHVHRRHLLAVTMQHLSNGLVAGRTHAPVAIGFADMVGFTLLSQNLSPGELATLVTRFTDRAYETVANEGGRVVKMIGDEVMFVAVAPEAAARIALSLAESFGPDEATPMVRVGLACGPTLQHEGDYFGPVVNLASRLVGFARPGAVLISSPVHEALEGRSGFETKELPTRRFKGFSETSVFVLRRPPPPGSALRAKDRRTTKGTRVRSRKS